jgi:hypothetical protein
MNREEMFYKASKGLLEQGDTSTINGKCRYRGPEGRKCGVGHLISDEQYSEDMEGRGVSQLVAKLFPGINAGDINFLSRLQYIHDEFSYNERYQTPEVRMVHIQKEMKRLGKACGFKYYYEVVT